MGLPRKRSRFLEPAPAFSYAHISYGTDYGGVALFRPWEVTMDEQNMWRWYINGGREDLVAIHGDAVYRWDIGGTFHSEKFLTRAIKPFMWSGSYFQGFYSGPLFAGPHRLNASEPSSQAHWNRPPPTDPAILQGLGGTAISRCKPTNPHASVAQSLIELRRDGLPSIPFSSTREKGIKGIPEDHLNYEFGIKPLISDLQATVKAARNAQAILRQYHRDSGRLVRRKYSYPIDTQTVETVDPRAYLTAGNGSPLSSYAYQIAHGEQRKVVKTERSYRFSGAFMYKAADAEDRIDYLERKIQEANHLIGIAPTPEVIWDTLPWSWFLDWFANIGDVVSNVSSMLVDDLVVAWGYLTEVIRVETQITHRGAVMNDGSSGMASITLEYESKRRVRATPFGFGFDMTTLSSRQWAILASLGLSQGGRWKAM